MLSVTEDVDNKVIIVKMGLVDLTIPDTDFAILTLMHFGEGVPLSELLYAYQNIID